MDRLPLVAGRSMDDFENASCKRSPSLLSWPLAKFCARVCLLKRAAELLRRPCVMTQFSLPTPAGPYTNVGHLPIAGF